MNNNCAPKNVSIVIPTYNADPALVDAIDSVLDAKDLSIQIVIMEDGSDKPSEIILKKQFSELLGISSAPHAIEYYKQSNKGAYIARLNALSFCNSDYIKFLDQDDVLISGALSQEVAAFDDETDVVMSHWRIDHYPKRCVEHCKAPVYTDPISDFLTVGGCFTSAALYRTAVAQKTLKPVSDFKPIKADDWLIFAQVCLSGARYKTIDIESYCWNQHEDQLSKQAANQLVSEHYNILNFCENCLIETGQLTQQRKKLLVNYYAKQLLNSYGQDTEVFEKILLKISSLDPQYRNQHGHKIYQRLCNLIGLRSGTRVYSQLKSILNR